MTPKADLSDFTSKRGQSSDCVNAEAFLDLLSQDTILLADKGYDTDGIRARIQSAIAVANIPAKINREQAFPFSASLYRDSNLVERFFGKIKNVRGLATRHDKRSDNFVAALKLLSTPVDQKLCVYA